MSIKKGYMYSGKKLVHRLIWEAVYGKIPDGYHVHHKDGNRLNNKIENLECLSHATHLSLHANERKEELANCMSANNEKLHEWHRSEEGKRSLSRKAKNWWKEASMHKLICSHCNKEFETNRPHRTKYCHVNCQQAARRVTKVDNEERICVICSQSFLINKYQLTKTCSFPCRNKLLSKSKTKSKL